MCAACLVLYLRQPHGKGAPGGLTVQQLLNAARITACCLQLREDLGVFQLLVTKQLLRRQDKHGVQRRWWGVGQPGEATAAKAGACQTRPNNRSNSVSECTLSLGRSASAPPAPIEVISFAESSIQQPGPCVQCWPATDLYGGRLLLLGHRAAPGGLLRLKGWRVRDL